MSSRAPIQVPLEIKEQVEGMKGTLRSSTAYEVIQKLIEHYHKSIKEANDVKSYQVSRMVEVGQESKRKFAKLRDDYKLDDAQMLELLVHHLETSPSLERSTFDLYRKMRG